MNFRERFNIIVDTVDELIEQNHKEIIFRTSVAAEWSERDLATVFKAVTDQRLITYIKQRKVLHITRYKYENPEKTWNAISEEFGFTEYDTFFRQFKKYWNCSPEDFMTIYQGGVPDIPPMQLNSIMEEKGEENIIEEVKSEEGKLQPEGREDEYIVFRDRLFLSPEEEAERSPFTMQMYEQFEEMEKCREIYGLSQEQILDIYNEWGADGLTLDNICDMLFNRDTDDEDEYYESDPYDPEDVEEYEREIKEFYENELTLEESYAYYFGDDEMEYEQPDYYD